MEHLQMGEVGVHLEIRMEGVGYRTLIDRS